MHRFLKMTVMAAAMLGAGQMAMAESRPDGPPPQCRQKDRDCPPPPPQQKNGHKDHRPGDAKGKPPVEDARRGDHERGPAPGQPPRDAKGAPAPEGHKAPRPGDNGRDGRPYQRAENSRHPQPPKGQEYRVVRGQLVLVNKKTHKVMSVIGPVDGNRQGPDR